MENEKKIEENKIEEVKEEQTSEEKKAIDEKIEEIASNDSGEKKCEGKGCCKGKFCKKVLKNKSNIAIAVLVVLIIASVAYKYWPKKTDIGPDAIKTKVANFIKGKVPDGVSITTVTKENGLYKVVLKGDDKLGGQEQPVYVSIDGNKIFQGAIDINQAADQGGDQNAQATPEKTAAENKTDVPTVDLFVMSYCPYGLQMERGILPAVEALGSKIKFNLKFVGYTLHGQKEVDENVRQYCIEKTQPAKLDNYLKCFWKDSKGTGDACMKSTGINAAQVTSCVAETNKQFSPTEKAFTLNKDEADKFGVQGSPTLVVNGTTISSGRDSASVLKAICSGFKNQPKECSAQLSSTSPVAGFDDQAAGNGGSSAPASCH